MKKPFVALIVLMLTAACATQPPSKIPTQVDKVSPGTGIAMAREKPVIKPSHGELVKNITISKASFDPKRNETVDITFELSRPARTRIHIYDPDCGLIRQIESKTLQPVGLRSYTWDGRDLNGAVVPDEAYFFTIRAEDESGAAEVFDPAMFSGGEERDITTARVDPQTFDINYTMPEMGRVMIRMGIQGGPLMNQLVDWKPRVKGAITEHWDGKDKDHLVKIYESPKFKMIITYFTLPDHSIITYGNRETDFRTYKKSAAANRPRKDHADTRRQGVSPHFKLPRTRDYTPGVTLSFRGTKGLDDHGLPILNEKTIVKVTLDEKDKAIFQNSQFEICFYLNQHFYAEDESGYTPFNWVWDLKDVEEGEHLLTVNISSFTDQIGVISKKVRVVQ